MRDFFWYKICPFCKQGRLFVYKNLSTDKLYLHCEECERGYYNIENLNVENSFLTIEENFDAAEATMDDIIKYGWDKYDFEKVNL